MDNMIEAIRETPQIVTCDRVSGDDCFVARAHVRDVLEMEAVIDRLLPFGATNSSVVQSALTRSGKNLGPERGILRARRLEPRRAHFGEFGTHYIGAVSRA